MRRNPTIIIDHHKKDATLRKAGLAHTCGHRERARFLARLRYSVPVYLPFILWLLLTPGLRLLLVLAQPVAEQPVRAFAALAMAESDMDRAVKF